MRIAIVGAGLAGLACAHELERLGLAPEIYEKLPAPGERPVTPETLAQFMHHNPGQDALQYIREELELPLHPAHGIIRMVVHSPHHQAEIGGHLGYVFLRGAHPFSMEKQLERHVRASVQCNSTPNLDDLRRDCDWVVVATGDQTFTQGLSRWEPDVSWAIRGATVKGEFTPGELHFFLNPRYAGTGYAMLSAVDEQTAVAGVAMPNATIAEAESHWAVLREEQGHRWQSEAGQIRIERYGCGRVGSVIVGNAMLVGSAGGFVECLGINGVCTSLASGVMAARQIALRDRSLERFARRWRVYYSRVHRLRRNVNAWTDEEMDHLTLALKLGGNLLARSPWNLLVPGAVMADVLRLADDPSSEVGLQ